jgi:hypothetical protein
MPTKVTGMLATRVLARTIRLGKEHARLVVAGIITFPGIRHKFSISNDNVPSMRCSIQEEASRDIGKMMEILPLQGHDTSNISRTSPAGAAATKHDSGPNCLPARTSVPGPG